MNDNSVKLRFAILKTAYKITEGTAEKFCTLYPAQVEGMTCLDMGYELRFLKEKNLLDYSGNFATHKYKVALTPDGVQLLQEYFNLTGASEDLKEQVYSNIVHLLRS